VLDGRPITIDRNLLGTELAVMPVEEGDAVLVTSMEGMPDSYFLVDYDRDSNLLLLSIAFIAVVLLVSRGHGAWSLIGLAASLIIIIRFIIPGILAGYDPPLIAFFGALVIMGTTLYMAHGMNWKTSIALTGTGISLLLAIILANVGIDFVRLTGLITEEATTLNLLTAGQIDARGLLLAGIIIGALGVLDDVTVAQASAVFELRSANPFLRQRDLFQRGMNVGRDHIAATVNTLFLAYAGAALPLLIVLATHNNGIMATTSQETIATEIVRSLIGGIAISLAVPITTALAALLASRISSDGVLTSSVLDDRVPHLDHHH
jgi:uncharacterized membrane protein